jgi:hypothetical protein
MGIGARIGFVGICLVLLLGLIATVVIAAAKDQIRARDIEARRQAEAQALGRASGWLRVELADGTQRTLNFDCRRPLPELRAAFRDALAPLFTQSPPPRDGGGRVRLGRFSGQVPPTTSPAQTVVTGTGEKVEFNLVGRLVVGPSSVVANVPGEPRFTVWVDRADAQRPIHGSDWPGGVLDEVCDQLVEAARSYR